MRSLAAVTASPGGSASTRRVLLVEDDPIIRVIVAEVLEEEGYAVQVASDGLEALNVLRREVPDLVMLDLMMPGMNGRELLDALDLLGPNVQVPVLLATAAHGTDLDLMRDRVAALLPKPFDIEVLLDTIASLLRRDSAADPVMLPTSTLAPADPPTTLHLG